jgi:hypothetical protein
LTHNRLETTRPPPLLGIFIVAHVVMSGSQRANFTTRRIVNSPTAAIAVTHTTGGITPKEADQRGAHGIELGRMPRANG